MGSSFVEMANLLDRLNNSILTMVGVFIIVLSYFILLGTPIMSYVYNLKNTKEEANKNNDGNLLFVHIKTGIATMVISFIISVIYFFVFVDVLHVGKTSGEVIKKVLLLDTVKPTKSIVDNYYGSNVDSDFDNSSVDSSDKSIVDDYYYSNVDSDFDGSAYSKSSATEKSK